VCGIVIAAAQKPLCENFVVSEIAANCLQRKGFPFGEALSALITALSHFCRLIAAIHATDDGSG
jgi:hypothetical protein